MFGWMLLKMNNTALKRKLFFLKKKIQQNPDFLAFYNSAPKTSDVI